jgi:hypothetical protein
MSEFGFVEGKNAPRPLKGSFPSAELTSLRHPERRLIELSDPRPAIPHSLV